MGTNTRVGWSAGAAGFVLLFLAQVPTALAAALLLPLVGVVAGLGMAKWLPRAWYGRQLQAGLRAGAIAAGAGAAGLLLSMVLVAPHSMGALAARSHLLGLSLAGQVHAVRGLGWIGVTLLASLLGGLVSIACAGLTTQAFAFDKSRHAIQVVDRAREAAQRSNRATAAARPTRRFAPTPTAGMVLGQAGDQRSTSAHLPVPNPWAEPATPAPGGQLDLGAAHSRELHEALAAWAGTTGVPTPGRADSAPAAREDEEAAPPEQKPGNWLC